MQKQTFVVTLEVPSDFEGHFPRIEAKRMADIIRDGVEAKSCSFVGVIPFKISVERVDEEATVAGQIREELIEELEETEEALQTSIKALDVAKAQW